MNDGGEVVIRDSVIGVVRLDRESRAWVRYSEIEGISLSADSAKRCEYVITPTGDLDDVCP